MNRTRIFLSLALLCLVCALAGCQGASTPAPPSEGRYTVTDGTLIAYHGSETQVALPDDVVAIGSGAFAEAPEARSITRITLGTQVEEIDLMAFSGLPALQGVELSPENTSFRSAQGDRSGCSFLCAVDEPMVFCFPGEEHTVELSADDDVPYFYGENTELKLACQGAVFHVYRHTDGDNVSRWYCRAIRWCNHILEFQEAEDFSGGNYQSSVFTTHSGDIVFQRSSHGSADAWILTPDGPMELHPGYQPDGNVTLYPGVDGSLRYRKVYSEYTDFDQLAEPPQGVDDSALYSEEGAVSLADGSLVFTADRRQTVSEYWAARNH